MVSLLHTEVQYPISKLQKSKLIFRPIYKLKLYKTRVFMNQLKTVQPTLLLILDLKHDNCRSYNKLPK